MVSPARDRDVDQAVARGSELLKQNNFDGAQKVFRAALTLDAGNPRLLALLGLTFFRAGSFAEARPIYEELVERLPTDASHRLNLGLVYLKLGEADQAIGALEASRALDPSQGRAVSYLGLAYARGGRYAEAYRSFLLAGQNELAKEIEINLTPSERDAIHQQLLRSGLDQVIARTMTPQKVRDRRVTQASDPPPIKEAEARQEEGRQEEGRQASGVGRRAEEPEPARVAAPAPVPEPEPEPEKEWEPEPQAVPVVLSQDPNAPRMTESLQFVLPTAPPASAPEPGDGRSMISRAVDAASASAASAKSREGNAIPLSQLATSELVRAEDADQPFEVNASGTLVIRLTPAGERLLTRLEGVHVTGGDLAYEPATRRSRGHQTEETFDYGGAGMHVVSGRGYLIALPGEQSFTAVALDDDIFYLREDLVFAFEASLRWENGNVPGLRGRLPVVQFRGDGSVVLRTKKPLVRVKLPAQGVVFVDAARLAGWIGRVIPRAVVPPSGGPMGGVCVECTGEGVVLVDPIGDPASLAAARPKERAKPSTPPPPPPPPAATPAPNPIAELLIDGVGDDDF